MSIYDYKCDSGKEVLSTIAPMGMAPEQMFCKSHQSPAYRLFSTGAAYMHPLKSAYYIPPNAKTEAAFIKQEERRGHDVRGRRIFHES